MSAEDWARKLPKAESGLVAICINNHRLVAGVADFVQASDFSDPTLIRAWQALVEISPKSHGSPDGSTRVLAQVEAALPDAHAAERISDLYYEITLNDTHLYNADETVAHAFAHQVVTTAADRFRRACIQHDELGPDSLERLLAYQARLNAAGPDRGLLELSISGDELLAASTEPTPMPVVDGVLWPRCVTVLGGRTKIGKTFLVCHVIQSLARGVAPWGPDEMIPDQRILVLSRDDASPELARRFRHLEPHDVSWATNLEIRGKETSPPRLDAQGMEQLAQTLTTAAREQRPFAGVVIDPYTHFLPTGARLAEDESAAEIMGSLDRLCTEHGVWVWVLHHVRKKGTDRTSEISDDDLIDEFKGAGGIVNLARAAVLLQKTQDHERRLVSWTNYGPTPRPLLLQVCDQHQASIDRFVPVVHTATPIASLFNTEARFTFTDYIRTLLALEPGKRPTHRQRTQMYPAWKAALDAGEMVATEKVRNAQYYRVTPKPNGKGTHDDQATVPGGAERPASALDLPGQPEFDGFIQSAAKSSKALTGSKGQPEGRPSPPPLGGEGGEGGDPGSGRQSVPVGPQRPEETHEGKDDEPAY